MPEEQMQSVINNTSSNSNQSQAVQPVQPARSAKKDYSFMKEIERRWREGK